MHAKETQQKMHKLFEKLSSEGHLEWSVRTRDTSDFFVDRSIYAPRLDIAIGPFNTDTNADVNADKIAETADKSTFIKRLIRICENQNGSFIANPNPRCLLAIEIEFSGSSKHILGDFTNASMMGHIGLVIGSHENIVKIKRIGKYAQQLRNAGKAHSSLFMNTLCFEAQEFVQILNSEIRRKRHVHRG